LLFHTSLDNVFYWMIVDVVKVLVFWMIFIYKRAEKHCCVGSKYLRWTVSRLDPFFSTWTRKFEAIASSTVSQCCLIWNSTMTGWLGYGRNECFENTRHTFFRNPILIQIKVWKKISTRSTFSTEKKSALKIKCRKNSFTSRNPAQRIRFSVKRPSLEDNEFWLTQGYIFPLKFLFPYHFFVRDNLCVIVLFEFIQTPLSIQQRHRKTWVSSGLGTNRRMIRMESLKPLHQ